MALRKYPKVDLRMKYSRYLEISFIISLAFLIAAFKFFPEFEGKSKQIESSQELFTVEDIQQTKQENRPPPPKPPIPIEAPANDVMEDVEIATTEIDLSANINELPPPSQNTNKIIEEESDYIFKFVEQLPEPIGGIAAIQSKIIYPEIAIRAGVEGKVVVSAFIDEKGNVMKTSIIKSLGAGCDEAAIDAIMKTKFLPGKQRGKPVKVQMTIPVMFKLQ